MSMGIIVLFIFDKQYLSTALNQKQNLEKSGQFGITLFPLASGLYTIFTPSEAAD